MAGGVLRKYSERQTPAPARVYCDATFLLDCFSADTPAILKKLDTRKQARAKDALGFLRWGLAQGSSFHVSLLAVEECAQVIVVKRLVDLARSRGGRSWKDLRSSDPAVYRSNLAMNRAVLQNFEAWMSGKGFTVFAVTGMAKTDDSAMAKIAIQFATQLLKQHEMDAMDAMHISIARAANLEWAATGDRDWRVAGILDLVVP